MSLDILKDYPYDYDILVENCSNLRISKTYVQKFCRFYYDIVQLQSNNKSILYINLDRNGTFKDIETIENYYNALKFRYYYFFLFSFIYLDFSTEGAQKIGNDLSEEFDNLDLIDDEWKISYVAVANIRGYLMALDEYKNFLSNRKWSVKKYLDADLIEKKCRILKEDVKNRNFQYLTYYRNVNKKNLDKCTGRKKKISHSKRLRNAQKGTLDLYEFQEEQQEQRDQRVIEIMQEYYDLKRRDRKLTINEFLQNHKISKRTFFNYKKIYDKKFYGKSRIEKAYQAYSNKLEEDQNFKITADFVSQFKVSQRRLKQYINQKDASG